MKNRNFIESGKWYAEFDENGKCVAAVFDVSYRKLLGYESEEEFAVDQKNWMSKIHPDDIDCLKAALAEGLKKNPEGMDFDVEYRMMTKNGYHWFHDCAHCTRREDGSIVRCDGVVFDIQDALVNEKQKKEAEILLTHERLRGEILNYMVNNEGDPIELLKNYAERIRVLINCDQVIYRDLEETRIMVNSPAIEKTWSVPIEFCMQCEHFNAHHPMYKDGYTEMDNCQEGWQGIPVYKDCPIKSSLTRLVYCDGEIAGYLAIHYVQDYHHFTDVERTTIEEFARVLSLSLSRYEAKKSAGELNSVKKTLSMTFALSDQFDPIIVIDPETGEYDWLMSVAEDVVSNTSMTMHGDNIYKNVGLDGASIIHEDDRARFQAFYTKENMMKIAETGEQQEIENRWFIQTENKYRWKYNKAVRMVDDSGKVYVVVGVMDTTDVKEKEERYKEQKKQLEERQAIAENSARFFALEDSFESLYDVELGSGNYTSYVKCDFYQSNVTDKLVSPTDYFEDLRANIDAVIYEEDRDGLYNVLTRDSIRKALSVSDHFDYYYRLNTENGPVWFKMRVVYKNAEKKNVIIGVFTAEDEMVAKRQEELFKQELLQTNARLFALEDSFESLYDIDLESGNFISVDRGSFYQKNVTEKLVPIADFFEGLRTNILNVVYEEDRENVKKIQTRELLEQGLADSGHIDMYYRIVSDNGPVWMKMRIVYKDAEKKNVIIGVFDAEEEMATRQKEELFKQELMQTNARLFALEDSFESLYDIDLESGNFISVDRGSFYQKNVTEKLVPIADFFEGLRANIQSVVYEEDRERVKQIQTRELLEQGLVDKGHIDMYYRIISDNGPVWMKMRIVYKDAEKKNVIIGVFDAEEEMVTRQKEDQFKQELVQTNARLFALADDFESLYDVEFESGNYTSYVKGDFYQSNVMDKLISPTDFFDDLIVNIDVVIYEEDRDGLHKILTRKSIRKELAENDHFDYYYRINTENGPVWFKMRIVYKDEEKKNIIIGVFNASEDVEAKQIAEQKERLQEASRRNELLHKAVKAGMWSYDINENDEVVAVYYDDITENKTAIKKTDSPMSWIDALHPEDKNRVLAEFMATIRDHSGNTLYETTYRLKSVNGEYLWLKTSGRLNRHKDGTSELFGISIDITEQINEQKQRAIEAEESQKLIDGIAASYNIAFAVNMETDSFKLLRMDDSVIGKDCVFNTFKDAKDFFVGILPESDRKKMRHELDYATIREKLKNTKSYNVEYRISIDNAIVWHVMNITLIDNDSIAIGFANRDMEITQKHLEDKRFNEYFALYEIDIDSGMMKIVKDSPYYEISRAGTAMPYKPAMLKFASGLDDEPRAFFEQLADLENVVRDLATEDKRTYAYKSRNVENNSWVECTTYVTLRHEDGTPAMFTFGFSMIDSLGVYRQELQSKYKKALDIVNEEKKRNDLLHDIIHSGKWSFTVSADDKVVDANYSEEVMRVINNDFSTGITSWAQIVHPDDAKATFEAFDATIADHSCNTPYDVAYRMADRNGVYHWFHSAGRIVRHEDGTGEFFGIHIDITSQIEEQLKQQKLLEDARVAAEAANQAKTNFLFNMSHDIRTPMNAIRGFTSMAKKHADDEEKVIEYINKIDISGQQLLALINQVLEMARIDSGKVEFEEKPVNVREQFNSMVTVLAEQANVNGLKFTCTLGNVKHENLLADEARVSSITLNIVGNAMKYTPEGGSINFVLREVKSRKPGYATYVMTVSDTGIGMSEEYLKELYEPFTREKSSTVSKIQGTGLGMSIVKHIIDLMGGHIEVQSELDKGTRFDITLDFKIDWSVGKVEEKEEEEDFVSMVSFKGRRVLLVEDNEMNREIAKDALEEQGIIIEDAEDGDVAVAKVKAVIDRHDYGYYDFILMDVQMPRMNGYEATKAIREISGSKVHFPIIAMTANAFEEDRQNALAAGMDEHLAKPIDVQAMFMKIAKFLK